MTVGTFGGAHSTLGDVAGAEMFEETVETHAVYANFKKRIIRRPMRISTNSLLNFSGLKNLKPINCLIDVKFIALQCNDKDKILSLDFVIDLF